MNAPVLVTGGTGGLGSLIVPLLRAAGREVRLLTRGSRPPEGLRHVTADLRTGQGIDPAVEGVGTVLHLAGGPKGDDAATRNLVAAAELAGVEHLLLISVIGADRLPIGYFRAKAESERALRESSVPWTILRAAQFHDLTLAMVRALAKSPLVPVPGMRWEPVDARDVAERLTALTLGAPAGRVPDLAGPEVLPMGHLLRTYLAARGTRRLTVPLRIPGAVGRSYRAGENLAGAEAERATRTWEGFLAERVDPARPRR
ncbi:NAD(P)H-binding protein [Nocardiopsis sp. N85]|uniref:SDR family oxidoreductase n=1 Tax=Nocardiopsis sp. N85 TaxID=3029400 RepID=UPI00237EEDB5|nr:NAD(P)H-binding protein [Nocardiopsis sp. N85]MDE3721692.1 NAD(P)H-binding protein [Nocardiopsis sp. N85]